MWIAILVALLMLFGLGCNGPLDRIAATAEASLAVGGELDLVGSNTVTGNGIEASSVRVDLDLGGNVLSLPFAIDLSGGIGIQHESEITEPMVNTLTFRAKGSGSATGSASGGVEP
jgi:hypothetical protein